MRRRGLEGVPRGERVGGKVMFLGKAGQVGNGVGLERDAESVERRVTITRGRVVGGGVRGVRRERGGREKG